MLDIRDCPPLQLACVHAHVYTTLLDVVYSAQVSLQASIVDLVFLTGLRIAFARHCSGGSVACSYNRLRAGKYRLNEA